MEVLAFFSSNFFEFCGGHHEIYYLCKFRPVLVATVVAELPEEVCWKVMKGLPQQSALYPSASKTRIV